MFRWIIFICVTFGALKACMSSSTGPGGGSSKPVGMDSSIYREAAELNKKMPMIIKDRLQIDAVKYDGKVIRIIGKQLWKQDLTDTEKENLSRDLKTSYCKGAFKAFAAANISVEHALTTQPRNLQDLSTETWTMSAHPSDCK
ncbi:hypothetical protein ACO0LC_27895 [Undibacterium sp. JH2W]|uniref:hypothetical protein n=1 Tax=Undibacterium sp. JH2W TaxID=3413037 RepID=UPI003BEFA6F8